jgi:hypothetical protein
MKPLASAISSMGRVLLGNGGSDVTNIQCKTIQSFHNGSLLYNEYVLIKMKNITYLITCEKLD